MPCAAEEEVVVDGEDDVVFVFVFVVMVDREEDTLAVVLDAG